MSALVSESGSVIQTSISFQKHFIIILIISNLNPRLNLLPKVKDRINQLITEKEGIPKDHGAKNTHTNNSLSIKGNLQMLTTSVSSSLHPLSSLQTTLTRSTFKMSPLSASPTAACVQCMGSTIVKTTTTAGYFCNRCL